MVNYLIADSPAARRFLACIGREGADLGPYILVWLSDEELAEAKARGLDVWDDLSGEKM